MLKIYNLKNKKIVTTSGTILLPNSCVIVEDYQKSDFDVLLENGFVMIVKAEKPPIKEETVVVKATRRRNKS